ncbi:nuclear factor 7, brain [Oryzias melastigma]|uniref:nuclear factor 7, brain n=1 Tax=Oryzias melastigma TaxID=30732 RepID=UPI000CF81F78|nr:nuclear factor 7, brain [Oryzias melastigma]
MASEYIEEQFKCSICLDSFINPTSIPCGHNFCLECIKQFWDTQQKTQCPLCKEIFLNRPNLRINMGLRDITDQFQRSLKEKAKSKKAPPRRANSEQSMKSEGVPCDICRGSKLAAAKSCLVCQVSYCEIHLTPHLRDPVMMKHRLTDPATFAFRHVCRKHNWPLEMFCKKEQMPVCTKCAEGDHKHHETVPVERESIRIKTQIKNTQMEIQEMIHARLRKTEKIAQSLEMSRLAKELGVQKSAKILTIAKTAVERHQDLLTEEIEQKHEEAEAKAEEFVQELQRELLELHSRNNDLQQLEENKDPLCLLQSYLCLSAPLSMRDWSKVRDEPEIYMRTVRRSFTELLEICHELEHKLLAEELSEISKYSVDVTLDPATAAEWLVLSSDGKKVALSPQQRRQSLPQSPRRFDSCVAVLGKQSFTSGRHLWVVQVGDKSDWDLGVARESINPKGSITVRPDSGFWAICRRNGGSLRACAGPSVTLNLHETPFLIGIFLDYEEGSVSFYDIAAKTHIYTFSNCAFTEPLYPYFNPCLINNGKNTEPLVICPVDIMPTESVAV